MKRIVLIPVVLAAVLTVLIGWKIHAQDAALHGPSSGSGIVEGTVVDLSSRVSAHVAQVRTRKGASVHAGDVLVVLDCADARAMLQEAEARARAANAQLEASRAQTEAARAQALALRRQSAAARLASRAAGAQAEALRAQRDAAARTARRLDTLAQHTSEAARDQGRAAADGLEAQVRAAQSSTAATRIQVGATTAQGAAATAQSLAASAQSQAAAEAAIAADAGVQRARLLVAECEVRAPRDGIVQDVYYELGELPLPGSTLVRLVDLREVRATFYLPNAEIAVARPGARAVVSADAYPGASFPGTVDTVAPEAEFTPRNIQTRTDRDRLVYAIEVHVPNSAGRLRPGMPVTVTLPDTRW